MAADLFIANHRKGVRHAGNLLVAVILGKNNLHLDGSRDFGAFLGLGLFLSAYLDHWLAEYAEQNQIDQFLHCIPPGRCERCLRRTVSTEVIAASLPLRA